MSKPSPYEEQRFLALYYILRILILYYLRNPNSLQRFYATVTHLTFDFQTSVWKNPLYLDEIRELLLYSLTSVCFSMTTHSQVSCTMEEVGSQAICESVLRYGFWKVDGSFAMGLMKGLLEKQMIRTPQVITQVLKVMVDCQPPYSSKDYSNFSSHIGSTLIMLLPQASKPLPPNVDRALQTYFQDACKVIFNEEKEESQRMKATLILQGAFEYNRDLRMLLKQPLEQLVELLRGVRRRVDCESRSSPKRGRWTCYYSGCTMSVRPSE